MMEYGRLLTALALTWLPGCAFVMKIVPRGSPGRFCLVAGYGLLFGLVGVPLLMRGLSAVGIGFSLTSIGLLLVLLLLAGLRLPPRSQLGSLGQLNTLPGQAPHNRWEMIIIFICAGLIISRLATLGMEAWLRPLYAWDSKQHWAKQAKIFFELGSIPTYVPFNEWLELGGANVYTTVHPDYPITVPLLQAWTSTAIGTWHESLISLFWVLCYTAMGFIFFGQALAAGARIAVAAAATYMLLSLPNLNIQVALAGYADLFLACSYLAAVSAFFNWSNSRDSGQAILWIAFAISGLLIKNEGFFWALSFIPGLMLVVLGLKRGLALILGLFLLLLLALWLLPGDLVIAGQGLGDLNLHYRPESWQAIYKSFMEQDNWHLLGYLFVLLAVAAIITTSTSLPRITPVAAVVLSAFCLFLALYLLTNHFSGAVHFTSINRVALQIVPAIAFLATLFYLELGRKNFVS